LRRQQEHGIVNGFNYMNLKLLFVLAFSAGLFAPVRLNAQAVVSPTPTPMQTQLHDLVQKVQAKIQAGKDTEADLADELKSFDRLIAGENGAKTDEAAQIVYMKAMLYLEVFRNFEKGAELFKQIKTDYPDTKYGQSADKILGQIASLQAELKLQDEELKQQAARFPAGQPPLDFAEKDLDGKPISIAALKGKVVLIDFWATWCPSCVIKMPNVIAAYQKHHGEGFEIIGVSLDDDRDQLNNFIKKHDGMAWPQYFDGRGPDNKLAAKYGIHLLPFAVLLDRDGKIIGTYVPDKKLESAVGAAVAKK
jgi:thiol-disulfide isomerase/thioredoxin